MATIKIQLFICVIIEIMLAQAIPDGPHTEVGAFVYVETLLGWNDAQSYCMNVFGTSLATATTIADNNLLRDSCDVLKGTSGDEGCPADFNLGGPPNNAYNCGCWIGLFREDGTPGDEHGPWEWADGCTEYDYRNWATGVGSSAPAQPDNRNNDEECVSLFKDFPQQLDGTWADRPCDGISGGVASQYFFCNSPASGLCTESPTRNPSPSPTIVSISPTNSPTGSSDSSEDCCSCSGSQSNKQLGSGSGSESNENAAAVLVERKYHKDNHNDKSYNETTDSIQISLSKSTKIQIILLFIVLVIFANVMCCWCKNKQH